jgi:hypothetical protein
MLGVGRGVTVTGVAPRIHRARAAPWLPARAIGADCQAALLTRQKTRRAIL